jgi:hypothetical protein
MTTSRASKTRATPMVSAPKADKSRLLTITRQTGKTADAALAEAALGAIIGNGSTAVDYSKGLFPGLSLSDCVDVLKAQVDEVNSGNLSAIEARLAAQAVALEAIFNCLAKRAIHTEYMEKLETYLRLGLKAQSQCRTTLETLAAIKNPSSVAFVRQANIAHGPQQVNNAAFEPPLPRARDTESAQTKLLEAADGERLDTRATGTASAANPPLAAVGAIHGPEDTPGESQGQPQRLQGRDAGAATRSGAAAAPIADVSTTASGLTHERRTPCQAISSPRMVAGPRS